MQQCSSTVKLTTEATIFLILFISSFSTQIDQFDFLESQSTFCMLTDFLNTMTTLYIDCIEHWNKQTNKNHEPN